MEQKWDRQLPEGRNPDIKFMAHVWEDLRVLPKPLALHLACEAMSMVGHAVLRYMGFRMDSCQVQPLMPVTCHGLSTPLISLHSDAAGLSGHEPWRGTLCCGTWAFAWTGAPYPTSIMAPEYHARFCLQQPHMDPCGAAASWHERARSIRSCVLNLTPLALCAGFHVLDQAAEGGEEACGVSGTA